MLTNIMKPSRDGLHVIKAMENVVAHIYLHRLDNPHDDEFVSSEIAHPHVHGQGYNHSLFIGSSSTEEA